MLRAVLNTAGTKPAVRSYRFGPYELEVAGELRKFGSRIQLQRKPFQLLLILVERQGQIVTRSELRQHLWPDVNVDFEKNLNIAVKKVRDALCDDAEEPKFVETIPGQGYRFIRPVETKSGEPETPGIPFAQPAEAVQDEFTAPVRRWFTLGVVAVVVAVLLGAYSWRERHQLNFTPRGWVVIAAFENHTSEPLLDGALEAELSRELAYSRVVNVAPPERVYDALRLMKHPLQYPVDAATSREVCLRDGGIQALLFGRVTKVGGTYEVTVFVENPQSGAVVDSFEENASGQQQLIPAMHAVSDKVRERLGEEVASIKATDAQLLKVTSPSLEAVQLYSRADAALRRNADAEAEQLLKRALEKDPNFASAWNLLGWTYGNQRLNRRDEELRASDKAFQLTSTVSDREAYFIRGSYYHHRHDFSNAIGNYEALLALYPDDWWANNNLWYMYMNTGREKEALRLGERTADMRPTLVANTIGMWISFANVNDRARADKLLARLRHFAARGTSIGANGQVRLEFVPVVEKANRDDWRGALDEIDRVDKALKDKIEPINFLRGPEAHFYISMGKIHAAEAAVQSIRPLLWEAEIATERDDRVAVKEALDSWLAHPDNVDPGLLWHLAFRAGLKEEERKLAARFLDFTVFQVQAKLWHDGTTALMENHPTEAIGPLTGAVTHFANLRNQYYFLAAEDLANAYERSGSTGDAIRALEPLEHDHRFEISTMTMPTHARYHLWQLYRKAGHTQDAAKLGAELSELAKYADPDHPYLAQFRR